MDRLSDLFGERVHFRYTCLDRIVLHGYLTGLQRPGQLVHFCHDVVGVSCIEPKVLLGRTTAYRGWVDRYTAGQGIPVLAAPQGVRKEELVRPYYGKLGPHEGIACVLTSLENSRAANGLVRSTRIPPETTRQRPQDQGFGAEAGHNVGDLSASHRLARRRPLTRQPVASGNIT